MSYPTPPSQPVASNVFSTKEYLNRTHNHIDNQKVAVLGAQPGIRESDRKHIRAISRSTCIILRSYTISGRSFTEAVGTGILVSESQIITAKHTVLPVRGSTLYVGFGYIQKNSLGELFKVETVQEYPHYRTSTTIAA